MEATGAHEPGKPCTNNNDWLPHVLSPVLPGQPRRPPVRLEPEASPGGTFTVAMAEEQEHLQSEEDLEEILRLAVRRSPFDGDLRARLRQNAEELGITAEQLAAAEAEYALRKQEDERLRREREAYEADLAAFRKSRWSGFYRSLASYLAINGFIHAINWATSGGDMRPYWAVWPLLGMGIGIVSHLARLVFSSREEDERKFRKWRIKNGVLARVEGIVNPKTRH